MGNYYSYKMLECDPEVIKYLSNNPNLEFDDRDWVEMLVEYGYVNSKHWDMIKDMCKLSSYCPKSLICVWFTHEDTRSAWKVLFIGGKYTYIKQPKSSEFESAEDFYLDGCFNLNNFTSPDFESDRNTFDLVLK